MTITNEASLPTAEQLEAERRRLRYKRRYNRTLRSTVAILIVAAALAVLAATLWMPVLRVYGSSMSPTLQNGQILVSVKSKSFSPGDIIAFYHGNKLLLTAEAQQNNKTYQLLYVMPAMQADNYLPQAIYSLDSFKLNQP